jgi:hypothetical protein
MTLAIRVTRKIGDSQTLPLASSDGKSLRGHQASKSVLIPTSHSNRGIGGKAKLVFGLSAPTAEGPTSPRAIAAARRNASAAIASVKTTCVLWPRSGSNLLPSVAVGVAVPLSPSGGMVAVSAEQRSSVPMDALAGRGGRPPKKTVKIGSGTDTRQAVFVRPNDQKVPVRRGQNRSSRKSFSTTIYGSVRPESAVGYEARWRGVRRLCTTSSNQSDRPLRQAR